mmetsp:Transcript_3263/g.4701  ORF Transcript_3263/g.4701 Transcript_3263/m.4701 type:complete len:203 (-) Transcript_3263:965-1573(-)
MPRDSDEGVSSLIGTPSGRYRYSLSSLATARRKSASSIASGCLNPNCSKWALALDVGPAKMTSPPSPSKMISSNKATASGEGCRSEITAIRFVTRAVKLRMRMMSTVEAVSSPVDISSPNNKGVVKVSISPRVTLLRWPPLTPRICSFPTYVSFTWLSPNPSKTNPTKSVACTPSEDDAGNLQEFENCSVSPTVKRGAWSSV